MKTRLLSLASALLCASTLAFASASYVPGPSLGKGEKFSKVAALAIGKDDKLLVADASNVRVIDPDTGSCTRIINTDMRQIAALCSDGNEIWVFENRKKNVEKETNGKKVKISEPVDVRCRVYSADGDLLREVPLAEAKAATSAAIWMGRLYLADLKARTVLVYNAETGAPEGRVGRDMRLCCGIFDVRIDRGSNELLLSNLGAFKLQRYAQDGTLVSEFGKRGNGNDGFHGCCNPVSSEILPDGNLLTVEKEPARVRIYTKDGKFLYVFPGMEELVKGCDYVSVAVNSKGVVFLGVNVGAEHYVAQYLPQNS